jgi:hypothetical protein
MVREKITIKRFLRVKGVMEGERITVRLENGGFPSLRIEEPEFQFLASAVRRLRELVSAHLGGQLSSEEFVLSTFDGNSMVQLSDNDEKTLLRNQASLVICPVEDDQSGRKRRKNMEEREKISTERERREALRLKREAIEQERVRIEDLNKELEREELELQEEEAKKNHLKRDHEDECGDDFDKSDWGYKESQGVPPFESVVLLMREFCKLFGRVAFLYLMARKAGVLYDHSARKDSRHDDDEVVLYDDTDLTESEVQQRELEGWFRSWWCNDLNTMKKIGIAVSLSLDFAEILSLGRQRNFRESASADLDAALDYQFGHAYEDRLISPTEKNCILVFSSSVCHRAGCVVGLDDYIQNFHSIFCKSDPACLTEDALMHMLKLDAKDGCCWTCGIVVHPDLINCERCANRYNSLENCVFVFCLSCGCSSKLSDCRGGHCNICDNPMPDPSVLVENLKSFRQIAHFIVNSLPEGLLRQIDVNRQACVKFTGEDWKTQFNKFYRKFDDWSKFWRCMEVTIPMKDPTSKLKLKFKGDVSGITSRSCQMISKKPVVVVDSQPCSDAVASLTRVNGNGENDLVDDDDSIECEVDVAQTAFETLSVFLDYAVSIRLANLRHHSAAVSTELLNATEDTYIGEERLILSVLRKLSPMSLLQMLMEAPLVLKRDQMQGLASLHLAVANFIKAQPDDIAKALKNECLFSLPRTILESEWKSSASHLETIYLGVVSNVVAEKAKERLIQLFGEFAKSNGVGNLIRMMFRLPFYYHFGPPIDMEDFAGIANHIYRLALALVGNVLLSVEYGRAFGRWFMSCNFALNDHSALATAGSACFHSEVLLQQLQQQPSDKHLRVTPWLANFCMVVRRKLRNGQGWLVEYCHKNGKRSKPCQLSGLVMGSYMKLKQEASMRLMETCACKFGPSEGACLVILADEIAESYGENGLEIPVFDLVRYFGVQKFSSLPNDRDVVVVLSEDVILDRRNGEMIPSKNVEYADKFLDHKFRPSFAKESLDELKRLKPNESLCGWVNRWKDRYGGVHLPELIVLVAHFAMVLKRDTAHKEKFSVVLSGESDSGKTALMEFFAQMIGLAAALSRNL